MKIIVLPLSKITQCLNKPAPVSKAAKRLAKKIMLKRVPPLGQPESTGNRIQRGSK